MRFATQRPSRDPKVTAFCYPIDSNRVADYLTQVESAEPYIGLLIQIPLVGIFVWFSLRLIDLFLKALDARDIQWRQFIEQERVSDRAAIQHMAERFSTEIRELGKAVAKIE